MTIKTRLKSSASVFLMLTVAGTSVVLSACAALTSDHGHPARSFSEALQVCRAQQPNRIEGKFWLSPSSPRIRHCLEAHGWKADGKNLEG